MSLAKEIQGDLDSGELSDLFQEVTWNGKPIEAIVGFATTTEGMDTLGGPVLTGERDFKFRRSDLLVLKDDLKMLQGVIRYAGRSYDVTEKDERPGHPIVTVRTTLRP